MAVRPISRRLVFGRLTPAMRAKSDLLALPLLVPWVRADDHRAAVPLDHAAAFTHGFDRGANFHGMSLPGVESVLAETECDAAACEVVRGELDLDPVAGQDADVVLAHLPGDRREHAVTALELDAKHRARERFHHLAFDLDLLFLLCHHPHAAPAPVGDAPVVADRREQNTAGPAALPRSRSL